MEVPCHQCSFMDSRQTLPIIILWWVTSPLPTFLLGIFLANSVPPVSAPILKKKKMSSERVTHKNLIFSSQPQHCTFMKNIETPPYLRERLHPPGILHGDKRCPKQRKSPKWSYDNNNKKSENDLNTNKAKMSILRQKSLHSPFQLESQRFDHITGGFGSTCVNLPSTPSNLWKTSDDRFWHGNPRFLY